MDNNSSPLLVSVVSDRGSFSVTCRWRSPSRQSPASPVAASLSPAVPIQSGSTIASGFQRSPIHPSESSADRGYVRHPLEAQSPKDHWIVSVVLKVAQSSIAQHEVHDYDKSNGSKSQRPAHRFCVKSIPAIERTTSASGIMPAAPRHPRTKSAVDPRSAAPGSL